MRFAKPVLTAFVVCLLIAVALTPASADDLADRSEKVDAKISDARADLEAVSADLQTVVQDLAQSRTQLPEVRALYTAASTRLATAQSQLSLVRQRLGALRYQQQKSEVEIAQGEKQIERSQLTIGRIVRYQYQNGGFAELQMVMEAQSPGDLVQRLMSIKAATDSQSAVIDRLNTETALLSANQQELETTRVAFEATRADVVEQVERLQQLTTDARDAKQRIEALVSVREEALALAHTQRASEQQRIADLRATQEALANQVTASTSSGSGAQDGQLIWPVSGEVIQGVGWRVHPVYGYKSCHTGVDIPAAGGIPIKAARGGVVVWANTDDSDPNGFNTLIDHGNGLSTLYAHQSRILVSAGEQVGAGQVIGEVGSTGYSTGDHLHFEVRINGVPYDPMGWFGGTKRPQSEFCP